MTTWLTALKATIWEYKWLFAAHMLLGLLVLVEITIPLGN